MKAETLFDNTISFEGLEKFIENYDSFGHVKAMIITIMEEYASIKCKELEQQLEKEREEKDDFKAQLDDALIEIEERREFPNG